MINYQLLGKTGLRVADLCLGTMTFGDEWGWGATKDEASKIYDYYREQGGNFIDTANIYTNGTSEKFVGEFIAGHRNEVVLATKYNFFADDPTTGTLLPSTIHQLVSRTIKGGRREPSLETHRGHEQLSACLTRAVDGGWILKLHRKRNQPMIRFQLLPQFSARKNEVLRWLVEGMRNGEIAAILKLSPRTVAKHVQDILNEFKVENRATASVRAVEFCAMPHGETPSTVKSSLEI